MFGGRTRTRRQYQGVVFEPKGNVPEFFNLWEGYAVDPKPGEWALFRHHIEDVIANGRKATCRMDHGMGSHECSKTLAEKGQVLPLS